jgi:hypothetical protein
MGTMLGEALPQPHEGRVEVIPMLRDMQYRFEPDMVDERFGWVGKWGEYRRAGGMSMFGEAGHDVMGNRGIGGRRSGGFTGALTANMRPDGESGSFLQDWGWDRD